MSSESTHKTAETLAKLGPYELLHRLGQGGMGAVYLARHSHLDKQVAIKLLPREHLRSQDMVARFKREMKAVGKLHHPNIIQAFDGGELRGVHFLVLELAEGLDLHTLLGCHGAVPVSDACELIRQTAIGLEHAHLHGLVHRDIKPANLFLAWPSRAPAAPKFGSAEAGGTDSDGAIGNEPQESAAWGGSGPSSGVTLQPVVKILDLGLALLQDDKYSFANGLTGTGQIMGTLDYMAPEQTSDTHTVDIRADIYSLGCTLYALLAGAPPFAGEAYTNAYQKIVAHNQHSPRPLYEVRRNVPPEVVTILNTMLAKNPDDRFTSPIEVAAALEPFCQGNTLLATLVEAEARLAERKTRSDAGTQQLNASALEATAASAAATDAASVAAHDDLLELLRAPANDEGGHTGPSGSAAETLFQLNVEAAPTVKQVRRSRTREAKRFRIQLIAAAACAVVGIILAAVVLRIVTNYGTIELTLYHKDAQVTVDGNAVRLRPGSEDDQYLIRVTPGRRNLQIEKDGYTTFSRDIEIAKGETKLVGVRLLTPGVAGGGLFPPGQPAMPGGAPGTTLNGGGIPAPPGSPRQSRTALLPLDLQLPSNDALSVSRRQNELADIDARVRVFLADKVEMPDPNSPEVMTLVDDLVTFRAANPATDEAVHAAKLIRALPSPFDLYNRDQLDGYELDASVRELLARNLNPLTHESLDKLTDPQQLAAVELLRMPYDRSQAAKRTAAAFLLAPRELVAIRGNSRWQHWASANSLAWSHDGKRIASGGCDFSARIWDAETGDLLLVVEYPTEIRTVCWLGQDRLAVTGSNGKIALFDTSSGRMLRTWQAHPDAAVVTHPQHAGAAVAAWRQGLLSFGADGGLKAWHADSGESLWAFKAHEQPGWSMNVTPDGSRIVTGDVAGGLKVWEAGGARPVLMQTLSGHSHPVDAVAVSPNGKTLVSASGDNENPATMRVLVHDAETGQQTHELPHDNRVLAVAFSLDGKFVAACGWCAGRGVAVWDAATWKPAGNAVLNEFDSAAYVAHGVGVSTGFDPAATRIAKTGQDGSIKIAAFPEGGLLPACSHVAYKRLTAHHLAITPEGRSLISQNAGTLDVWQPAVAESHGPFLRPGHNPGAIALSPDGRTLYSAQHNACLVYSSPELTSGRGGAIAEMMAERPQEILFATNYHSPRRNFAIDPRGSYFVASSSDSTVRLLNLQGDVVRQYGNTTPGRVYRRVDLSPNMGYVAASESSGEVCVWQLDNEQELFKLDGERNWLVKFDPRGRWLALGGAGGSISLRALPLGNKTLTFHAGTDLHVYELAWSNQADLLAGLTSDGHLTVWQGSNQSPAHHFLLGPAAVYNPREIHFAPDGRHLVVGCCNGVAQIYRLTPWSPELLADIPERQRVVVSGLPAPIDEPSTPGGAPGTPLNGGGIPAPPGSPRQSELAEFDEPPPLDQWLRGREILTVKQDGTAKYTTIQAALDDLKPGQVVEVLDKGPYRETLAKEMPADTGLISRVQSQIVLKEWQPHNSLDPTNDFFGHFLRGHFRLHGFTMSSELTHKAILLSCHGTLVLEACVFPNLSTDTIRQRSFSCGSTATQAVTIRDCAFGGDVYVGLYEGGARLLVERNYFLAPAYGLGVGCFNGNDNPHFAVVRQNIFSDRSKHAMTVSPWEGPFNLQARFQRNTVLSRFSGPAVSYAVPDYPFTIQGNLVVSPQGIMVWKVKEDFAALAETRLVRDRNLFAVTPTDPASLPLSATDLLGKPEFLSRDPLSRDYARLDPQHVPNTAEQFGALPPGPAPPAGDWFTRLQERWQAAQR